MQNNAKANLPKKGGEPEGWWVCEDKIEYYYSFFHSSNSLHFLFNPFLVDGHIHHLAGFE
jgi:hypothetical protein